MMITFFVAVMTFDVKRIKSGRRDCLPVCQAPQPKDGEAPWDEPRPQSSNRIMKSWSTFLMHPASKFFVLILSLVALSMGIYGTTKVTERLVAIQWLGLYPDPLKNPNQQGLPQIRDKPFFFFWKFWNKLFAEAVKTEIHCMQFKKSVCRKTGDTKMSKGLVLSCVSRWSPWYWSRRFDRTLQVFIRRYCLFTESEYLYHRGC